MSRVQSGPVNHASRVAWLLLLLLLVVPGCFVTTDENLWKDSSVTSDVEQKDADSSRDRAVVDAPLVDGLTVDGPAVDGAAIDGPAIDGPAIDAPAIDAPAIDAPAIDAPAIDAPVLLPLGAPCTAGTQCQSNHCVDKVCCGSACSAPCTSCNIFGNAGTCKPDPAGTDPGKDCNKDPVTTCKLDGSCDGKGGCRSYVAGTACGSSCVSTSSYADSTCDGSGLCVPGSGGGTSCGKYLCDLSKGACYTSCTSDAQCKVGCNPAGKCK